MEKVYDLTMQQLRASSYSPAYNNAIGTVEPYRGTDHTVRKMIELARGARGEKSIYVRRHAEQIIQNIRPKAYQSECAAIGKWWGNNGRYTRDPVHVELIKDPERMISDAAQGRLVCDCDEFALGIGTCCLVIGAEVEFVTVGFEPRPFGFPKRHTHVFCRAKDPSSKIWWVLDPVAGRRTMPMLSRVKQYSFFPV